MNDALFWVGVLGGVGISCWIGYLIADRSGNGGMGVLLAVLLGPIGWLVAAIVYGSKPGTRARRRSGQGAVESGPVSARKMMDPVDAWEREQEGTAVPPVPEHLRGRRVED